MWPRSFMANNVLGFSAPKVLFNLRNLLLHLVSSTWKSRNGAYDENCLRSEVPCRLVCGNARKGDKPNIWLMFIFGGCPLEKSHSRKLHSEKLSSARPGLESM